VLRDFFLNAAVPVFSAYELLSLRLRTSPSDILVVGAEDAFELLMSPTDITLDCGGTWVPSCAATTLCAVERLRGGALADL
jgi:hypothetical protein